MKRVLLPPDRDATFLHGVPEAASAAMAADFLLGPDIPPVAILLAEDSSRAEEWGEDVAAFLQATRPGVPLRLHIFEEPPGPDHPDAFERLCDRLAVLAALGNATQEAPTAKISEEPQSSAQPATTLPLLVAATPEALLAPCPTAGSYAENELTLRPGDRLPFQAFAEDLATRFDYSSEILCEAPGQFAVRGGLVDVYPVNGEFPARIDFFGDEVEEVRRFDPTTQRTTGPVSSLTIASANASEGNETEGAFFGHLVSPVAWVLREPEDLIVRFPSVFHFTERRKSAPASFLDGIERPGSEGDRYLGLAEIDSGRGLLTHACAREVRAETLDDLRNEDALDDLGLDRFENERSARATYLRAIRRRVKEGFQARVAAGVEVERARINETIADTPELADLEIDFIPIGLREGFQLSLEPGQTFLGRKTAPEEKGLLVASARQILGRTRSRRPGRSRRMVAQRPQVDQALDFSELVEGDFLVHLQHGVCRYQGIGPIQDEGRQEEAITVEFADGILLHVPLPESHLLSRYVGLSKVRPKLAKLGGKAWAKAKEAAERAAFDLAADLLRLQAARETASGFSHPPDDDWQKEFEDAFPFTETKDQLSSIAAVKEDMESSAPMDRLLCGDVGFGKTEVAIRAVFKAVTAGKQVAVLAPTTVLCQQHLNVFRERMVDFPISIDMLSRFRSPAEQRRTLRAVAEGAVDVLVGTHRILSKDVRFKDLGLLVVDEEQRFGVRHKERIKTMKTDVDVLTLSATPIPRTLYFAMVGARALSAIETAPVNRRPIRTEVMRHSPEVVSRAIENEHRRNGQIFYLHNRVKTIGAVARRLREQFPKLRIAVGHGQMEEDELEQIMTQFVAHEFDILVCTTIIESGIDIPNCNTIIIEGADRFGLSQLYQLRGRVGRFDRQAYAYLLLNAHQPIRDQARKRLSAIRQITRLGAGFRIALRDLELRGAGNLLGSEQSGHVAGIGFDLYCRLLKQSVSQLKGDEQALRSRASVRLDFTAGGPEDEPNRLNTNSPKETVITIGAYLPESYAAEPRLRVDFYRKLAQAMEPKEVRELADELKDRFGPPPPEVRALLLETEIRCLAETIGLDLLETNGDRLACRFAKYARKGKNGAFLEVAGRSPRLTAKKPLLKLKEIVKFLKLRSHGKK